MAVNQAYKSTFQQLTDMEAWVGKELGLSDWLAITQEDINQFAKLTHDEQWIHVDPERCAKESPYKTTIAHGFMVLSLASKFAYETFHIDNIKMGVNYGFEKIRFPNATPVNSKVRARISLLSFEKVAPNGAKYTMKIVFELEGQEKPACVAEWLGMVYA